jgi:protein-S-isoprenylcysteine O-methyltransferase Ste14
MRKIFALIAIIVVTVVFGSWVWIYTYQPLLLTVVIALSGVGALSLLWDRRIFTWAGVCAAWAFYVPVLLALVQVSIGMAIFYGGWVAFFYGIWAPLLSFEATDWLVRGRIFELYPIQWVAPILILIGSALLVAGLAQVIRSKLQKTGFVTRGLYSLVRHPQYLGVNILIFGFVLYGLRPIDFVAWANLVFLHMLLAGSEEGKLQEKFGKKYSGYKKRVPFIVPFVPYRLRQRFGGLLPSGWKRKAIFIGIYLLTMAVLLVVLWVAWRAGGGGLMR